MHEWPGRLLQKSPIIGKNTIGDDTDHLDDEEERSGNDSEEVCHLPGDSWLLCSIRHNWLFFFPVYRMTKIKVQKDLVSRKVQRYYRDSYNLRITLILCMSVLNRSPFVVTMAM